MKKGRFLGIYTGVVIAYLFIPIAIMILFGFNDFEGRFNLTWNRFTLEHYANLFDVPELTAALKNSVIIALISTAIATGALTSTRTQLKAALETAGFSSGAPVSRFVTVTVAPAPNCSRSCTRRTSA